MAIALASATACTEEGQCLALCFDSLEVAFEPHLGAPGRYTIEAGGARCDIELPATVASCSPGSAIANRLDIVEFAVQGVHVSGFARSLDVRVTKDEETVLVQELEATETSRNEVCGSVCEHARFQLAIPENLTRPAPGPCVLEQLDGEYRIVATQSSGTCQNFWAKDTLRLVAGELQVEDCESRAAIWNEAECRLETGFSCGSTNLDAVWDVELVDALGDGAHLLGTGMVTMTAPITCEGGFQLALRRAAM